MNATKFLLKSTVTLTFAVMSKELAACIYPKVQILLIVARRYQHLINKIGIGIHTVANQ
jgi:hypothetical protein